MRIIENIITTGMLWGICLAIGFIFTFDFIVYKKEYDETGEIVEKKGKYLYKYSNPKIIIALNAVGMVLGYIFAISIIVTTIIFS